MSEPVLRLESRDAVRVNGSWRIRWRVTNVGSEHVRLVAVRAPHGRFRADSTDLNVVVVETVIVEQTLRVEAAPGEEIENAFVIFVVVKEHETWRVLFRVRVHVGADGTPAPLVEAMSTHRVGFAEA
ncbi:MAG TPA: hypothetical protein VEP48_02140 [Methylomirabilota bacterium]|nr:hypothetical protein [Methylomirabilota bacterium]